MNGSKIGRTLVGAALAVVLSTFTLAPARAASVPVITWDSAIAEGDSYVYGEVPAEPTCTALEDVTAVTCTVTGYDTAVGDHLLVATAVSVEDSTRTPTEFRPPRPIICHEPAVWQFQGQSGI